MELFLPRRWESGAGVISRRDTKKPNQNTALKGALGRCWLILPLLMPCSNLLPRLPWLRWMGGKWFSPPSPCGSLVNIGKWLQPLLRDGSRTKAGRKPSHPASSPGGDGGLTPQPEIAPSHKMVCLFPARGVRDHGAKGCGTEQQPWRGGFFSTSASDLVVGIHHIPCLCLSFPITREGRG